MRQILSLLALPVSIVLFLPRNPSLVSAAAASAEQWPYNLPEHAKYWPEDGPLRKRELEASQGPLLQAPRMPAGVRKMGGDEGEKFYMEFWEFDGQQESQSPSLEGPAIIEGRHASLGKLRSRSSEEDELTEYANATMTFPYKPALLRHTAEQTSLNPHFKRGFSYYSSLFARSPRAALAALQKRAFECPSGTNDCAEIGRSGSCCSQGEKCQIVPDTGTGGDVGCCPEGKSCSGNLGECDIGFTKCSDNLGGGCCIPMYICIDLGCGPGPSLTSLILVTPTVTDKISNPPTASASSNSTSTTSSSPSSSPTTTRPSSTTPQSTRPCSSGFRSCPASLGGGCCRTDRECGPTSCPASSSPSTSAPDAPSTTTASTGNNALSAPVRPTSNPPPSSTVTGTACPTGFYRCDAYYEGGCCRVGRDCGKTSCPATASTALVNSNGVTIVVPAGSGSGSSSAAPAPTPIGDDDAIISGDSLVATGSCASGWSSCPATLSGGCCPSGFSCAVTNCVAAATAGAGSSIGVEGQPTGQVGKIAPSAGVHMITRTGVEWWWGFVCGWIVVFYVHFGVA